MLTRNFRHDGHRLYFPLAFHLYLDLIGCLGELCHHPNMVKINKQDINFDKIRFQTKKGNRVIPNASLLFVRVLCAVSDDIHFSFNYMDYT